MVSRLCIDKDIIIVLLTVLMCSDGTERRVEVSRCDGRDVYDEESSKWYCNGLKAGWAYSEGKWHQEFQDCAQGNP